MGTFKGFKMANKQQVHNGLVELIYDLLAAKYDDVSKFVQYNGGELDAVLIRGRRAIVFEIKSSGRKHNRMRAYKQLSAARDNYCVIKTKQFYGFYCYWTDKSHTEYGIERLI